MQDMKKTVLAVLVVLGLVLAPAAFAQDAAQPSAGLVEMLGGWLQAIWESVLPLDAAADASAPSGEVSGFMGYTVPGG